MLSRTDNILQNISTSNLKMELSRRTMSVPHNIVMDPNNVMWKLEHQVGPWKKVIFYAPTSWSMV